ncbi:hypothetical protein HDE_13060 [Halotydeus destructor]|nr:hypothetical protein HDE_13060 [Halotydeus destructor]
MTVPVELSLAVINSVLAILMITANGFVVHVIRKKRDKLPPYMIYVSHQALSDIIHGFGYMSRFAVCVSHVIKKVSPIPCELNVVLAVMSYGVSSWFLAMLSLEIVKTLHYPFSRPSKSVVIASIIWATTFLLTTVKYIGRGVAMLVFKEGQLSDCFVAFEYVLDKIPESSRYRKLLFDIWFFLLPTVILIPCCLATVLKLRSRDGATENGTRLGHRKRQLIKMSLMMIAVYSVVNLPIHVGYVMQNFQDNPRPACIPGQGSPLHLQIIISFAKAFCLTNFVILCYFNKYFKAEFKASYKKSLKRLDFSRRSTRISYITQSTNCNLFEESTDWTFSDKLVPSNKNGRHISCARRY